MKTKALFLSCIIAVSVRAPGTPVNDPSRSSFYDELENLLDSIPPRKKLMLIDACHSDEVDNEDLVTLHASSDSLINGLKPVAYKKEGHLGLKNRFELMQSLFVNVCNAPVPPLSPPQGYHKKKEYKDSLS